MLDKAESPPLTAGAWLRQHREAAQISLEALSVALKVRPARLQALESDQLGEMPDDLFVRTLALGICRHLKADENALLPLLPMSPQRDLKVGRNHIHASPYNPNRWSGPMLFSPKRWPLKWSAAGMVIAVICLWWFWGPDSKEAGLPLPLPTPGNASSAEVDAVTPAPAQAAPAPVFDVPATSGASPPTTSPPVVGQNSQPRPWPEKVVITPVTPMALQQNSSPLPTQTTQP